MKKLILILLLLFPNVGSSVDRAFLDVFASLAERINPIVVHIYTDQTMTPNPYGVFPRELLEMFGFPLDRNLSREQKKSYQRTIGTGFVIDSTGLILTNNHVVAGAASLRVQLADKTDYAARVIGKDPRFDVAIIKIEPKKPLVYARLGDSDKVRVGEWVAAFGNPFGHSFSMSKGIISATHRNVNELGPLSYLQTDASINPGNSGGPLVNTRGEVIGVNTAIDRRAQGIGFAIPINEFKKIRSQLEKFGKVIRGYIGVTLAQITEQAKTLLKLPSYEGALVNRVEIDGPAYKSGIQPGDVIVKVDGQNILTPNDLVNKIKDTRIGKTVRVELFRDGKKQSLSVTVGSPEKLAINEPTRDEIKTGDPRAALGIGLSNYTRSLAKKYSISSDFKGPIITSIRSGGIASSVGLEEGDMIIMLNGKPVKNTRAFYNNLKRSNYNSVRIVNKRTVSQITFNLQ